LFQHVSAANGRLVDTTIKLDQKVIAIVGSNGEATK